MRKLYFPRALLIGALVCIAVFSTTYSLGGVFFYPRLFMAIGGLFFALRSLKKNGIPIPVFFAVLCLLFTLIVVSIHGQWSHFSVVLGLIVRGIIMPYFTAIILVQLICKAVLENESVNRWRFLMLIIMSAIALQAGLAFLQLISSEFRSDFINLVNLEEGWRDMAALGLPRFTGIGGISIYDTALSYCLFGAIFLANKRCRADSLWVGSILIAFLIMLCALHGRTGLLFMILLVLLVALQEVRMCFASPSVVLRVVMLILGGVFVLYAYVSPGDIEYILNTSGELFVNFFSGEGFRTDSTDDLLENYLVWPSYYAMLFGSGIWAQPDLASQLGYSYSTDSGFLLLLNFGGVGFLFSFLGCLFFVFYYYCKVNARINGGVFDFDRRLFCFYVFSILIAGSIKGPLFMSEHFMVALFLSLGIVFRLGGFLK